MKYSALVRDHFATPRNVGELEHPDGVGDVENPACGDRTLLTIRVLDNRISETRFRAVGCPTAIAASSITTELLIGRTVDEALQLTNEDVSNALGGLPANKLHCSVLAEDVIQAAVQDYHRRAQLSDTVPQ